MIVCLAPHHRAKVAELLADTPEFTPADVAIALELVDAALSDPERGDYRFLISEGDGRILGYACYGPTPMTEGCWDLYWLVVARGARRGGIGRELLAAVEDALRRATARLVRLETAGLPSYAAARMFYATHAYQLAGQIRDFYHPGNDLHIYVKYLPS
jgi:GNAT superfamily N-acetyltransferase